MSLKRFINLLAEGGITLSISEKDPEVIIGGYVFTMTKRKGENKYMKKMMMTYEMMRHVDEQKIMRELEHQADELNYHIYPDEKKS